MSSMGNCMPNFHKFLWLECRNIKRFVLNLKTIRTTKELVWIMESLHKQLVISLFLPSRMLGLMPFPKSDMTLKIKLCKLFPLYFPCF